MTKTVGVVIGGLVVAAAVGGAVFYRRRRKAIAVQKFAEDSIRETQSGNSMWQIAARNMERNQAAERARAADPGAAGRIVTLPDPGAAGRIVALPDPCAALRKKLVGVPYFATQSALRAAGC